MTVKLPQLSAAEPEIAKVQNLFSGGHRDMGESILLSPGSLAQLSENRPFFDLRSITEKLL